jgi:hypothetical protein
LASPCSRVALIGHIWSKTHNDTSFAGVREMQVDKGPRATAPHSENGTVRTQPARALSWEEVKTKVVEPLRALNPYQGDAGKGSIFKIEDINYGPGGKQRQLFAYSVSSKRYCMFVENERGELQIVKASAHGLGFLYAPFEDTERKNPEHQWIWDAWDYILALELDGPEAARAKRKPWFDLPAMMQVAITTPAVIKRFKGQSWARPLNFMLAVQLMGEISNGEDAKRVLVTPFSKDRTAWKTAVYRDIATGDEYTLYDEEGPSGARQVDAICYGGIIDQHRFHPEPKFCGSDGQPCGSATCGLLQRRHVQIGRKIPIRKETNRRWQEGEDLSVLQAYEPEVDSTAAEYVRAEGGVKHTSHAVAPPQLREWLQSASLNLTSQITGIKREHLRAIRDGKPARRETLALLADLNQRWTKGKQSRSLEHAVAAIRSGGW